jgi:hypothetical protein
MPGKDQPRPSFNEQAALEELERLQRQIEESRRRQRQAADDFNAFVRSFGTKASAPERQPPAGPPSTVRAQPRTMGALTRDVPTPPPSPRPTAPLTPPKDSREDQFPGIEQYAAEPHAETPVRANQGEARAASTAPDSDEPEAAVSPMGRESPSIDRVPPEPVVPAALSPEAAHESRRGAFIIAAIALIVMAVFGWRFSRPDDVDQTQSPAVVTPGQSAAPAPATASQPPAPVPPAELTTVRRVWVRVMVDGGRVLERELEGNVRIQLAPKRQVVIRAGDGGAVRLSIAGQDQGVLGQDGFPVTREFTLKGQ